MNKKDKLSNPSMSDWTLRQYRKQRLTGVSDAYLLDELGDYHGTQLEKRVFSITNELLFPSVNVNTSVVFYMKQNVINSINFYIGGSIWGLLSGTIINFGLNPVIIIDDISYGVSDMATAGALLNDLKWHKVETSSLSPVVANIKFTGNIQLANISCGTNLIAYCEEASGTTAYDSSGNNKHGTVTGSMTHVIARDKKLVNYANLQGYSLDGARVVPRVVGTLLDAQGNTLQFIGKVASDLKLIQSNTPLLDGTTGYGETTAYNLNGATSYNIKMSVHITGTGAVINNTVVFDGRDANNDGVVIGISAIGRYRILHNTAIFTTTVIPTSTEPQHLELDWNGTTLTFKVNGSVASTGSVSSAISLTNGKVSIGKINYSAGVLGMEVFAIELSKNGSAALKFNCAEGSGTTSWARGDSTKTINWLGGVTWAKQDVFHANIKEGFSDTGDGIERPYPVSGAYTNPAVAGHNNAETKFKMEVFREDLADCPLYYDQTTYASLEKGFSDMVQDGSVVPDTYLTKRKTDIEVFSPNQPFWNIETVKNDGWRDNKPSIIRLNKQAT